MKKLLLINFLLLLVLSLSFCKNSVNTKSEKSKFLKKNSYKLDTSKYRAIIHLDPNQKKTDSIKKIKTKNKRLNNNKSN
jgi:hypothetical protein